MRPRGTWVLPPSPGGWRSPWYLRWVPMGLRYGLFNRRWRCNVRGCRRSWVYDHLCQKHIQEFYSE